VLVIVVVVVCVEYSYGDYSDIYVSNDSRKNNHFSILNDDDDNCDFTYICLSFQISWFSKFCLEAARKRNSV